MSSVLTAWWWRATEALGERRQHRQWLDRSATLSSAELRKCAAEAAKSGNRRLALGLLRALAPAHRTVDDNILFASLLLRHRSPHRGLEQVLSALDCSQGAAAIATATVPPAALFQLHERVCSLRLRPATLRTAVLPRLLRIRSSVLAQPELLLWARMLACTVDLLMTSGELGALSTRSLTQLVRQLGVAAEALNRTGEAALAAWLRAIGDRAAKSDATCTGFATDVAPMAATVRARRKPRTRAERNSRSTRSLGTGPLGSTTPTVRRLLVGGLATSAR